MGLLALCQSYCNMSMPFKLLLLCKFSAYPSLLSNLSGCKYSCTLTSSSPCSSADRLHSSRTDLAPEPICTKMRASFTTWSVPALLQPSPTSGLAVSHGKHQSCRFLLVTDRDVKSTAALLCYKTQGPSGE